MENTRNTIQKKIIFNTLKSMKEHPSAQEVYEKVHEKHSTISRATVFRVLNNLASLGHLNRLRMPDMPDLYDYKTTGHYHIKCRE
ncbi:Fur family transcriptional regulator, partial [Anaerofustis stercorihominis]